MTADELANKLADGFLENEKNDRAKVGLINHEGHNRALVAIADTWRAAAQIVRIYSPDKRPQPIELAGAPLGEAVRGGCQ